MKDMHERELPRNKRPAHRRAVKLEWATILFFASAVTAIYLTMAGSQAMKAAWVEDLLAFVPPIAFLIAARIRYRGPNHEYPYGYHRVVAIAFLTAALALLVLGLVILYDSVTKLIAFEHPPIGLVEVAGNPVWQGWVMIAALAYTMFPAVILGRLKIPLARELNDKVLFADAEMNKADWMTAGAAIIGILGIGIGWWWADGVAATFISVEIVRDGVRTVRAAVGSLMDKRPHLVDDSAADPLPERLSTAARKLPWVRDARVRMREEGHVFYGEVFVVPRDARNLLTRIRDAERELMQIDWRLYDLVISPVPDLEEPQEEGEREATQT